MVALQLTYWRLVFFLFTDDHLQSERSFSSGSPDSSLAPPCSCRINTWRRGTGKSLKLSEK